MPSRSDPPPTTTTNVSRSPSASADGDPCDALREHIDRRDRWGWLIVTFSDEAEMQRAEAVLGPERWRQIHGIRIQVHPTLPITRSVKLAPCEQP